MHAVLRPYATTGVALVGASLIALTPIAPAPPEIRVANSAVQLTAAPNPFEFYPQILEDAFENADTLVRAYLADPLPIINAIIDAQIATTLEIVDATLAAVPPFFDVISVPFAILSALADGGLENKIVPILVGAASAVFDLVQQATAIVNTVVIQPFTTFVAVVDLLVDSLPELVLTAISPVLSGVLSAGFAIADVFDALRAGDPINVFNALVDIPGRILYGVLNGTDVPNEAIPLAIPGILTPSSENFIGGPIAYLIRLDQQIADAISSSSPSSISTPSAPVDERPILEATTLTLDTGPLLDTDSTQADSGLATPTSDTTTIQAQQGLDAGVPAGAPDRLTKAEEAQTQADQGLPDATGAARAGADATDDAVHRLDTARQAVTAGMPAGATNLTDEDLTDGSLRNPDHAAPPTNPNRQAAGVLEGVQERVEKKTSHVEQGLSNASEPVKDTGPSDSAPSTGAKTDSGE